MYIPCTYMHVRTGEIAEISEPSRCLSSHFVDLRLWLAMPMHAGPPYSMGSNPGLSKKKMSPNAIQMHALSQKATATSR